MDRNRALILNLTRCGPQAFDKFCAALLACGEYAAAQLLGYTNPEDQPLIISQEPRCHLDLGGDVYVTAKIWHEELCIHIRKYDVYLNGKSYPTKRGIVFTLKHWLELPGAVLQIKEAITDGMTTMQSHLGANMYASLDQNGVDIRQWEKHPMQKSATPTF